MKKTIFTSILTCLSLILLYGQGLHVEQGTSNNLFGDGGYLWVGDKSLQHLSLDVNEIQARFDFGVNTLYLNPQGGNVSMLMSGGSDNLFIDGAGLYYGNLLNRVGISTASPAERLDVNGNTRMHGLKLTGLPNSDDAIIESTEGQSADLFLTSNDNIRFDLDENNDELGELEVYNGANTRILTVSETGGMAVLGSRMRLSDINNTKSIEFITSGGAVDLRSLNANLYLTPIGTGSRDVVIGESTLNQIGVGKANPVYKIDVVNNNSDAGGRIRANGYASYSDERIKSNFQDLDNATDIIMKLNPMSYTHYESEVENGELKILKSKSMQTVGFVAQDMYNVLPDLVHKPTNEKEDLWAIDYTRMVPYLTKAVQEQQALIEAQTSMINEIKKEMKKLTNSTN